MDFDQILEREPDTVTETVLTPPESVPDYGEDAGNSNAGASWGQNGGFNRDDFSREKNPPQESAESIGKKSAIIVGALDFVLSRIGSWISGEDSDKYRATKREKKELETAVQMYLETLPPSSVLSAKAALITALIMYCMAIFAAAYSDKREVRKEDLKRKKKRKEEKETVDAVEITNDLKYFDYEVGRGKFNLNGNGNYDYTAKGEYIGKESDMTPHDDILDLIKDKVTGWEIKKQIKSSSQQPIKSSSKYA